MRVAKKCEDCYMLRDGKCQVTDMEIKNLTPSFKCPKDFNNIDITSPERYKNKDFLFQQHVIMRKTLKEICKECGVYEYEIQKWVKQHNITIRHYDKFSNTAVGFCKDKPVYNYSSRGK